MASIGENIKRIRKWKGFTQAELAARAGISTMSVRRYETGERELTFETAELIAQALEIDLYELIGNEVLKSELGGVAHILTAEESAGWVIENGGTVLDLLPDELNMRLQKSLLKLNEEGKSVAVQRIEELTEIPRYQAQHPAEQPSTTEDTPKE